MWQEERQNVGVEGEGKQRFVRFVLKIFRFI